MKLNTSLGRLSLAIAVLLSFTQAGAETVSGGSRILHAPFEDHADALYTATMNSAPMTLTFSAGFKTAMNAMGAELAAVSPASITLLPTSSVKAGKTPMLGLPVDVIGVSADAAGQARLEGVTGVGGIGIKVFEDDLTNHGGSLSITRLFIDTQRHIVGGDVDGGNGVGYLENVALWTYAPEAANFSVNVLPPMLSGSSLYGQATVAGQASGLLLTPEGQAIFEQSLGLYEAGKTAIQKVNTYSGGWGVLAVPEPSSTALMALGLAAVAVVRRRGKAVAQTRP